MPDRKRSSRGFTLVELLIVLAVIAILVAVAIPNFIEVRDRAKNADVKGSMRLMQLAMEDFAVLHDGRFASVADSFLVQRLLPGGVMPENAWTGRPTRVVWLTDGDKMPSALGSGDIVVWTRTTYYQIRGYGKHDYLSLILTSG